MPTPAPIRLTAHGAEDLTVISGLVQDMVLRLAGTAYDQKAHRFALTGNRFMHEARPMLGHPHGWRINSILHFNHIERMASRGIDQSDRNGLLVLLALETQDKEHAKTFIDLRFAGGGTLRLIADSVDGVLTDQGQPWDASRRPDHAA